MLSSSTASHTADHAHKGLVNHREPSTQTGVLLVNLGTPNSTATGDVRKYLRQFLMDWRVIDIPAVPRWLLVNGIIAPFRAPKSAKVYREVWLPEGSPLMVYGLALKRKLQQVLGDDFVVELGMRYQNPSVEKALETFKNKGFERIVVVPLFPQYASATSGSVMDEVMRLMRDWQIVPEVTLVHQFFAHPGFLDGVTAVWSDYFAARNKEEHDTAHFWQTEQQREDGYQHVVFSYHGLPERQIRKGDCSGGKCLSATCCDTLQANNRSCYRAQCFATTRLLAKAWGLPEGSYTTCFQSRLGNDPWIKPYTEDKLKELAKNGIHRVLALSPSFVADCLETTEEIGIEYKEKFEEAGGHVWDLLPCVNDNDIWVKGLAAIVHEYKPVRHWLG